MKAFFAIFFVSSLGLAYSPKYFDIQSYATQPIDVANEEKIISLRVEIQSPSSFSIPDAAILSEDEGFGCKIKQKILLFAGYDAVAKIHHQVFEIKVEWSPGADLSGCLVEVTHPSLTQARAYLFMNY